MKNKTLSQEEIEMALIDAYKKQVSGGYANLGRVALMATESLSNKSNFRQVLAVIEYYIANQGRNIFGFANITRRPPQARKCWVFQKGLCEDGLFIRGGFFRLVRLMK